MIRFVIENGNNWLKFDMPTCELADHLGSIGICKDISIGGTESMLLKLTEYPVSALRARFHKNLSADNKKTAAIYS